MNKFSEIINQSKEALQKTKRHKPISELKEDIEKVKIRTNFKKAIIDDEKVGIICEYKPASPSRGKISNLPIETAIKIFENGGTSAVSVITEETFFKSSLKNLKIASNVTNLPLLRKDFVLDKYQIYEAKACGASAVLLLAGIYPDLGDGIDLCNHLGIDALVECKNREEIGKAVYAGAEVIGINNRNFKDFTVDFNRTRDLAKFVPPEIVFISESGVKNAKDVENLCSYGADALLVGTGIMGADKMAEKVREIVTAAKNGKVKRK
ncbi:MAG: indole-3-glycerol-phosphate synthase [Euryarchaeota archaeon]|nr:indole-3-glycerol-phosphate synthase [Euryarchaeota archaeon]